MRRDARYEEAKWRVKIAHFTEKGFDIEGIIHVGANDGYEVQFYLEMGIEHIMCFEPYHKAVQLFRHRYMNEISLGLVWLYDVALGEADDVRELHVGPNEGQTSSLLKVRDKYDNVAPFQDTAFDQFGKAQVRVRRFDTFVSLNENVARTMHWYDCLVVDVQGMELDVLKGFGPHMKQFKFLNIECSMDPVYEGEAPADEVIAWLDEQGFKQDTPTEEHNDIMFIRKDLL